MVWGQTQKYPRIIGIGILNKDKVFRGNLRPLIFGVILICPSGKTKIEPDGKRTEKFLPKETGILAV
ncbi:hypothetical protein LEP1GSC038_3564 [Leptospira weilii str. 2006001855]|uniref:Uncharacterized protein n=1 Tax=Leptospira weilii str. 2006001855 TaxID=996804 RepID=M6FP40_9LEPT|nr:hypothetical protein LEP1GSC038_3564 [Leptospira weilii str. 2006001855]OMI18074.1 hypothetical protein BUQ74_06805 [Leptospira weilii serovar Heyan]